MKRFNISVPKPYTKDGVEKTQWSNVGTLVKFDARDGKPESFILEMNMFPTTKFGVFEQTPKTEAPNTPPKAPSGPTSQGVNGEVINPEDIPF